MRGRKGLCLSTDAGKKHVRAEKRYRVEIQGRDKKLDLQPMLNIEAHFFVVSRR